MPKIYAAAGDQVTERERRNKERARKIASEGMVLLENDGSLPLAGSVKRIALFGNGARRTVKGGTGSGDVNSRDFVTVEQGFAEAGFAVVTGAYLDRTEALYLEAEEAYFSEIRERMKTNPYAFMDILNKPFLPPCPPIPQAQDCPEADAAFFILARNSGEGRDRKAVQGDYYLSAEEEETIRVLIREYGAVHVVLNVGGIVDTKFFRSTPGIASLLLMSQAGNIGGLALLDVLTGTVTPSGKLTDTWAESYEDYPSADTFGARNGDTDDEYYYEGIYVGYRYFDSFGVHPAYPFGFGRSYTEFAVEILGAAAEGTQIAVGVKIRNTGSRFAGKEVVQVYVSAPSGKLEKPFQVLAGFGKTALLAPGESEELTIRFDLRNVASYSEAEASYLLEQGEYVIRAGTSSRDTHIAAVAALPREVITQKLSNRFAADAVFAERKPEAGAAWKNPADAADRAKAPELILDPEAFVTETVTYREPRLIPPVEADHVITAEEVVSGTYTVEDLVSQLTVEEMADLLVGTMRFQVGQASVIGNASATVPGAAGETTPNFLPGRHIPALVLADGPAGLRLSPRFAADPDGNVVRGSAGQSTAGFDRVRPMPAPVITDDDIWYFQYCTAIPIATLLAASWDPSVMEEAGDIVGGEMEEFGVQLWLAPGMNIHRNPLCGRNFEYYSEDPLLSGICAAADTRGVQKHPGVGTTIKHFALNNQEDNRMHVNSHVSERAIREIYLRGFEIAVREAQPRSIMTSYNLINGVHSANSRDLLQAVARDEWGFQGIVMTDWGTTGSIEMEHDRSFKYGPSSVAGCILAGNDLIMPGVQSEVDALVEATDAAPGTAACPLPKAYLQAACARVIRSILTSSAYGK